MLARIVRFIHEQGSVSGIQLAHAGRKASTYRPWSGNGAVPESAGGWANVLAPSAIAFADNYPAPREMSKADIAATVQAFVDATKRALTAGFRVIEIHAAHGYLIHEFLSPLSNQRDDEYGGSLEGRMRFPMEVFEAVRSVWPKNKPLSVKLSAVDWREGGWTMDESIEYCARLRKLGCDFVVVSSGGIVWNEKMPTAPGFQVPFGAEIRRKTGMPVSAVLAAST